MKQEIKIIAIDILKVIAAILMICLAIFFIVVPIVLGINWILSNRNATTLVGIIVIIILVGFSLLIFGKYWKNVKKRAKNETK